MEMSVTHTNTHEGGYLHGFEVSTSFFSGFQVSTSFSSGLVGWMGLTLDRRTTPYVIHSMEYLYQVRQQS